MSMPEIDVTALRDAADVELPIPGHESAVAMATEAKPMETHPEIRELETT